MWKKIMKTHYYLATQSQDILDVDSRDLVHKHPHKAERVVLEKNVYQFLATKMKDGIVPFPTLLSAYQIFRHFLHF